jgi:ABC-2 type transport system ATP-binding protein
VGDESFRNKCQKRIDKFWESHVIIIVVYHSMKFIEKSCNKAICLNKGSIKIAEESK